MTPALVLAAVMAASPAETSRLRCFVVTPAAEYVLKREEIAEITVAVREATRRPIVSIEMPEPSERAPRRVVQVVTLVRGDCANGSGDQLWIRRGARGWRVVRKVGVRIWGTAA